MNIYDRIMAIGTKMTEMDASTYQGAFIGKISYMADKEQAEQADNISYQFGEVKRKMHLCIFCRFLDMWKELKILWRNLRLRW